MSPLFVAARAPDFDLGQVVFIIMMLLGGFFQWVFNRWKKQRAVAAKLQQSPPTREELEAREKAWQHQTGAGDPLPPPLVSRSPLEDLLKTFRELAAPEIVTPPVVIPPPPKSLALTSVEVRKPPAPRAAEAAGAPLAIVQKRERHPLATKLALIGGLKYAVVLREILGPPKSLQNSDDSII